ncbi:DNA cytosine methyltransferase [Propionispira raffinosivorans]|uniref:DNA cytosine methyltransferase n=1 Tax=Propionispira raffinosivorans TaxID=86959 RepID=UPI0003666B59|nr:DNA cytosine methyltransferase [Propionispira raffinosivorans]
MIKLGTVFSGIGAIEQALRRMNLNHEIVFACDNGDVDIFSKKIDVNIDKINEEFLYLKEKIMEYVPETNDDRLYKKQMEETLQSNLDAYFEVSELIDKKIDTFSTSHIEIVLKKIVAQQDIKKIRIKEYKGFLDRLEQASNRQDLFLKRLQYTVECINDFKKNNDLQYLDQKTHRSDFNTSMVIFESTDNIDWKPVIDELSAAYMILEDIQGKKIIKQIRDIAERVGMLHEKINEYHLKKKIASLLSSKEKKAVVDALYKPYILQNHVRKSYLANYDLAPQNFHWNVSLIDGQYYKDKIDLFVGGSPCQSFSMVGKQRGLEDTRGTLFYEYARLISIIRPKVFIYENVKAVLSNDNGNTWETMKKVFDDLGYQWEHHVLNAKDYGIPQNRERVFVVGFRNDLHLKKKFYFPDPIKLETTVKDFLLDNVSGKYYLNKKGVEFVTKEKNLTKKFTQIDGEIQLCQKKNQQFNWHGDFVFVEENKDKEKTMQDLEKYFLSEKVKKYVLASGTKGFYSRPKVDLDIARPLLTTMHKMHRAGVDNYVTTEGRLRKLTPRECLRLMGFCDSFQQVVADTSMYQQAGNSIVVDVLIAIMKKVLDSYPELLEERICLKNL